MGIFDKAKDLVAGNSEKVSEGLDKASGMAKDKFGDKLGDHADKLDMVTDKAKGALGADAEGAEAAEGMEDAAGDAADAADEATE